MQKHPESLIIKTSTPYKHTGGVGVRLHSYLTFALYENAWSASAPAALSPGERSPSTLYTAACEGAKVGLNFRKETNLFP